MVEIEINSSIYLSFQIVFYFFYYQRINMVTSGDLKIEKIKIFVDFVQANYLPGY